MFPMYYSRGTKVIYRERFKDKVYKSFSIVDKPMEAILHKDLNLKENYEEDHDVWLVWESGVIAVSNNIESVKEIQNGIYDIDTGITILRLKIVN